MADGLAPMVRAPEVRDPDPLPALTLGLLFCVILLLGASPAPADLSFTKRITFVSSTGQKVVFEQKFYVSGDWIRTEEDASHTEGDPGIHIYDFKRKRVYTLMRKVALYMEDALMTTREALLWEEDPALTRRIQTDPKVKEEKTVIGQEVLGGRPVIHEEVRVIEQVSDEEQAVLLHVHRWISKELGNIPLRLEFLHPNGARKIVEYLDVRTEPVDARLFQIPKDYLLVNPY